MAVPTASDNTFPKLELSETTAPSNPAAGKRRLYVDSNHVLRWLDSSGLDSPLAALNKWNATVAPTVNEDSGDGYAIGSRWIDTTADKEYVCTDATVGAAVWKETTSTGGGGAVATDAIWDAAGDMVIGTGADTAARVAIGASGKVWKSNGSTASWQTPAEEPWLVQIITVMTPASQTNWNTLTTDATNYWGAHFRYSSGAQNAEITWPIVLSAGTWDLTVLGTKFTDSGIITVSFDGTTVGTIDQYNASLAVQSQQQITGISVATSGKVVLKLKMATKNASSSSYFGRVTLLQLLRTA